MAAAGRRHYIAPVSEFIPQLLAWKGALVALWFAALFAAERLAPAAETARGWFGDWPRLVSNAGLWLTTAAVSFLVVLPATELAARHALWVRPAWWQGGLGLALDLLILDFLIYWWHRANHVVPFLWRFHQVHHLDRFLDTTSALRFHFGEVLLSALFRAGVIVALGFPLASVVVFEISVLLAALFHHSNLRLAPALERVLSWIVVTPSIHWVHHHRVRADTDSNYATIVSLWDRLFGSRSPTARAPAMPIGVQGAEERTLPALLALPFLRRR
jgi:sterol desaturase/sphingolipid hydroxylase (fatty acid hydroxylase superfamily)